MLILNFSHPLTAAQLAQVEALTGQSLEQVVSLPVQFDNDAAFWMHLQVAWDMYAAQRLVVAPKARKRA